jgi:hypothetical protein
MASEAKTPLKIKEIEYFISKNKVLTSIEKGPGISKELIPIYFQIDTIHCVIHVIDEYEDLQLNTELLRLILVLRALVIFNDATDFLNWCALQNLNPDNTPLRNYYIETIALLDPIGSLFPNRIITSFITDLDFQLNAGVILQLRKQ